eukprot:SAG31_NODE_3171_length_4590_cov_5.721443_2_plen_74_part_00
MSQRADCLVLGGDVYHSTEHSFPGLLPACKAAGLTVEWLTKGAALTKERLEGKKVRGYSLVFVQLFEKYGTSI